MDSESFEDISMNGYLFLADHNDMFRTMKYTYLWKQNVSPRYWYIHTDALLHQIV